MFDHYDSKLKFPKSFTIYILSSSPDAMTEYNHAGRRIKLVIAWFEAFLLSADPTENITNRFLQRLAVRISWPKADNIKNF